MTAWPNAASVGASTAATRSATHTPILGKSSSAAPAPNRMARLGAALAFLLARHLARDYLRHRLGHRRVFKVVERWTAERGALAVALTRLFPIFPYSLLNFAFGLTQVGFWTYLFWSWLTMLPGHLFYVAGSDALAQGISSGKVPWPLVLLAAAVLVFLGLLVPWARRRLREGPGGPEPDTDEEPAAR